MYLSKFLIDRRNPSARQALLNVQDMHRNILSLFAASRKESGALYRLDDKGSVPILYLLSAIEPEKDIEHGMSMIGCADISDFVKNIGNGDIFNFDVITVPAKKVVVDGKKNSTRMLLKTSKERFEWWEKKADKNGFELLQITELEQRSFYGSHGNNRMKLKGIHYQGVLKVNDRDRFIECYSQGLGAEKAYGFGMILLKL